MEFRYLSRARGARLVPFLGLALLAATFALVAACGNIGIDLDANHSAEIRDDSFSVGASTRLEIKSFNGRIAVNAGSDGIVRVLATIRRADRVEYTVSQDGDTVVVEAKRDGATFIRGPAVDIEITAPSKTILELQTSNGEIEVYGIEGTGILQTSNGRIVMKSVTGSFHAYTSNGAIEVSGLVGTVTLETSNGAIDFAGDLTGGGNNEIKTSNGGVTVRLLATPSVRLDATTSNGDVNSRLPLLTTGMGKHHLAGIIGDGEAQLTIRTSNGSVTVQ